MFYVEGKNPFFVVPCTTYYIYIYTSKAHCIKSLRTTVPPYYQIPSALKNQNLKKETVETSSFKVVHVVRWYINTLRSANA
jgi:hypothetical protein